MAVWAKCRSGPGGPPGSVGRTGRTGGTGDLALATVEQLAGDLLPNPTLSQRIAKGFNRNHPVNTEPVRSSTSTAAPT